MDVLAELQRFAAASSVFRVLDAEGVRQLAQIARVEAYHPNDTIVQEGAMARIFYMVLQGGVRVVSEGGAEGTEVARLGAGQFFGEMGILNDEPRAASVRAIGETRCLLFEKAPLLSVLQRYPQVLHALGNVSVERAGRLEDAKS